MRKHVLGHIFIILLLVTLLIGTVLGAEKTPSNELAVPEVKYAHYSLENGLEVYVFEDDGVPLVEVALWYKVGSWDEPKDMRGISHLLEHTTFLGTNVLQKDQIHVLVKQVGGSNNAETSYAYTRYFEKVPVANLELAIAIEADRMGNLKIDPAELKREKEVVNQERRRSEINEQVSSALEEITPHHDIIGTEQTLAGLTPEKLLDHYRRYYTPNNAVLAVTGAVKPQRVLELARKYFGEYPSRTVKRIEDSKPESKAEQPKMVEAATAQPYMIMQYNLPAGNHPDLPAVRMVLGILESRVMAALKWNKKFISEVDCRVFLLPNQAKAEITIQPLSKNNFPQVKAEFDQELEGLIQFGIKDDQLKEFKIYFLRDLIFAQKTADSFSQKVIEGVVFYRDPGFYRQEIKGFNAVTNADLMRVAKQYFGKEQRMIDYIIPSKKK